MLAVLVIDIFATVVLSCMHTYMHRSISAGNSYGRVVAAESKSETCLKTLRVVLWPPPSRRQLIFLNCFLFHLHFHSFTMAATQLPIPEVGQPKGHSPQSKPKLYILDYGAGNVRRSVQLSGCRTSGRRIMLTARGQSGEFYKQAWIRV